MARIVTDKRKTEQNFVPDFATVVEDICKGEYVLVLGSDIMLDKNLNVEASGDSTRFFLERVIASRENCIPAETFPDFIIKNSYRPNDVRRWLIDEIGSIEFEKEDLTPDLIRLLATKCFRVVLTTVFDPSVEKLMDETWGAGNYRIMNIWKNSDFKKGELKGDEYFDVPPTLCYVFGQADPKEPGRPFVLDDNDTIKCISRWLGKDAPTELLNFIDSKKLLVLGCNLKDWAFRFFWYALRHQNTNNLHNGDIALLLQKDKSEQDSNLYNYLNNTIGVRLQTNTREYIHRLADALDEKNLADSALAMSRLGGIFISYASEDFAIANSLFKKLKEKGFNVWLDNRKLFVGNEYNPRIENAIRQCKVFLPLLTSTVAEVLKADESRYFRDEWEMASGENSDKCYCPVTTYGYDYRSSYHQKVQDKIREVTVFNWEKEPFETLVKKIEAALKS